MTEKLKSTVMIYIHEWCCCRTCWPWPRLRSSWRTSPRGRTWPSSGAGSRSSSGTGQRRRSNRWRWRGLTTSVGDPWHFAADPHLWLIDPDPTPFFNDLKKGCTIHFFSLYFFLIIIRKHIILNLNNLIFCKNYVLKFYFAIIIYEKREGSVSVSGAGPGSIPMTNGPDLQHCLQPVILCFGSLGCRKFSPVFARRFWPDDVFILTDGILTIFS